MQEDNGQKLFYPIGEVAQMFDLPASTIRFWEKEFTILKPEKNKKGNRLFTPKDIKNLRLIYHLVKERGYTLQGAKSKLKTSQGDAEKSAEITESLHKIRNFLVELKTGL